MKIALNTFPLHSMHKTRGIGYYTRNLLENLKRDKELEILEFTDPAQVKDVDVIHYPWFDFFFRTLPIKKKFPTVVTIHDTTPLNFPRNYPVGIKGKISLILQKISLIGCKAIISDSECSKKDIIKYLKINEGKIKVIPLAVDSKFKSLGDTKLLHVKRKYRLPDEFLLYVGDANWVKNLPFLVEGFNQLIKGGFRKIGLVLVGGVFLKNLKNIDHPELQSLKKVNQMIERYKLKDKILRPGYLDEEELVAFYNLATIYVQPSFYEGFGLSVLQALTCGTPVVSSNRGSLSEVGGDAAIYFDPTNLNQFISIIEDVLENKSLRNKLYKLGREQAAKFSWDRVVAETKSVYLRAILK